MLIATHRIPGLVLRSHRFALPLDYSNPSMGEISVFAREVTAAKDNEDLPWLVFLQGGPGFPSPRPMSATGWIGRAIREFRVLLLDQRGTGLSTRIDSRTLARFPSAESMAGYLRFFRADSIVRDCEAIRRELCGDQTWTVLGQSFGGFCAMRYLSAAPEGLASALFTGGIPPLTATADDVYRATFRRVLDRNRRYFERYPEDREVLTYLTRYLAGHEVMLPSGGRLTGRKLQQLGFAFGMSDGFEIVHYLLEGAFVEGPAGLEVSRAFLSGVENQLTFENNPIYAVLHEACYAQEVATLWSAERIRAEFPGFEVSDRNAFLFTGEMIFPWMLEEYPLLGPLAAAASLLAREPNWPRLYDVARLAVNKVPAAAVIYHDDMYVERAFSEEAVAMIPNLRAWITNEFDHNGLRADGEKILDRLLAMVRGDA